MCIIVKKCHMAPPSIVISDNNVGNHSLQNETKPLLAYSQVLMNTCTIRNADAEPEPLTPSYNLFGKQEETS